MVATLLRLRFRVLGNQLARSPWQLVGFILGGLWALGALAGIIAGLVALRFADLQVASYVLVGAGSLLILGWVLGPLLAFGVDDTLDPMKLAVFPMTLRRMMVALTVAGVCGIAGIVTTVASLTTLVTWSRWPIAIPAALVCIPIAVLTAVIASRAVAAMASGLGGKRRLREATGVLVFIPLMLAGPIIAGVATGFALNLDAMLVVIRILGWTPLGAAWAVPADLAAGLPLTALAKFAIAVAGLALVWVLWRWALADALAHPRAASSARVAPGKIGLFGRVPASATGAVYARSLTYWLRDPRYQRQLITVPLILVLLWFYARNGDVATGLSFAAPLIALMIGTSLYADVSYDGTAFGTALAAGVRGRADRLGRILAASTITVPLVLAASIVPGAFSGDWGRTPAVAGMAIGVLLAAYGVCAVTSAQFVVPVPASGDNAFKRVPGTGVLQSLSYLLITLIAVGLSIPSTVLGIISLVSGSTLIGWIALATGLVVGSGVLIGGIVVGGRTLDRTGPVLFSRLKAMRTA